MEWGQVHVGPLVYVKPYELCFIVVCFSRIHFAQENYSEILKSSFISFLGGEDDYEITYLGQLSGPLVGFKKILFTLYNFVDVGISTLETQKAGMLQELKMSKSMISVSIFDGFGVCHSISVGVIQVNLILRW